MTRQFTPVALSRRSLLHSAAAAGVAASMPAWQPPVLAQGAGRRGHANG